MHPNVRWNLEKMCFRCRTSRMSLFIDWLPLWHRSANEETVSPGCSVGGGIVFIHYTITPLNLFPPMLLYHCENVIRGAMASQITSPAIVYSTVYTGTHQRKHQSPASLAFLWGIHRWPVNSPYNGPVTRKMFPFDDVIMLWCIGTVGVDVILPVYLSC